MHIIAFFTNGKEYILLRKYTQNALIHLMAKLTIKCTLCLATYKHIHIR